MPYQSGEVPEIGDQIRHLSGREGVVSDVQLDQANLRGEDQVSVKWKDGGVGTGIMLARELFFVSKGNPDSYHFVAYCPVCNTTRGVSCSRRQAKAGGPVEVYAIQCDHSWKLTPEQREKLIKNL